MAGLNTLHIRAGGRGAGFDAERLTPSPPPIVPMAPPTALKLGFIFALLAPTLLDRFGLGLSATYSIGPGMLAMYSLVAALLWTRTAYLNLQAALLYVGIVALTGLSLLVNLNFAPWQQQVSLNSWALLLALYAPFVLQLRTSPDTTAMWHWMMRWFLGIAATCAVFGITQYFAQYVVKLPWLIDFTSYIPAPLRGSGTYNTSNAVGRAFKSNGFFMREASGFSFLMAFALVWEWRMRQRIWLMALFVLGLIVSYSGSGILALIVAVLVSLGPKTLLRVLGGTVAVVVAYLLLGDVLGLSYTVGRVNEFGSDRSSAYCRFILPAKTVAAEIDSRPWVSLLGHGPGTMQKITTSCETTYAKMLFEYGLAGGLMFIGFMLMAVRRMDLPRAPRAMLLIYWYLLGGHLLGPEALVIVFTLFAIWPSDASTASVHASRAPTGTKRHTVFASGWKPDV